MGDGITKAERRSEVGTLERNILLIDALSVEFDEVLEWPEIGWIALSGSGIFDVVEREFVFSSSCNGCTCRGASALETAVAVSARVFLPAIRLDERLIEASDDLLEDSGLELNLLPRFSERGKR